MPSGRLAFATRRVDLMAAKYKCTFGSYKRGKKLDQMVVRVQGAPVVVFIPSSSYFSISTVIPLGSVVNFDKLKRSLSTVIYF